MSAEDFAIVRTAVRQALCWRSDRAVSDSEFADIEREQARYIAALDRLEARLAEVEKERDERDEEVDAWPSVALGLIVRAEAAKADAQAAREVLREIADPENDTSEARRTARGFLNQKEMKA